MGIVIEPGTVSESYITNIEGILQRVQSVLMTASKWVQEAKRNSPEVRTHAYARRGYRRQNENYSHY